MKNTKWEKTTVLPATMRKCAFCPIAHISFYCWMISKSCHTNWTQCVSRINNWTVSTHYSGIDSRAKLLPTVENFLPMCRGQVFSTNKTTEWIECAALQKKASRGKRTKNIPWAFSKRQNQRERLGQSLRIELYKLRRLSSNWQSKQMHFVVSNAVAKMLVI